MKVKVQLTTKDGEMLYSEQETVLREGEVLHYGPVSFNGTLEGVHMSPLPFGVSGYLDVTVMEDNPNAEDKIRELKQRVNTLFDVIRTLTPYVGRDE